MDLREFPQLVLDIPSQDYLSIVNVHGITGKVFCTHRVRDYNVLKTTIQHLGDVHWLKEKMKDKSDTWALTHVLNKFLESKPMEEYNAAHYFMLRLVKQLIKSYEISVRDNILAKRNGVDTYPGFIDFITKNIDSLCDTNNELRTTMEQFELQFESYIDLEDKIVDLIENGHYFINIVDDYFYISILPTSEPIVTKPSEDQ